LPAVAVRPVGAAGADPPPATTSVAPERVTLPVPDACFQVTVMNCDASLGATIALSEGLRRAGERGAHALIFYPDAGMSPGAISEMFRVMIADPMTAFVGPRSSRSGLTSFPHSESLSGPLSAEEYRDFFQTLNPLLPDRQYVPTCAGFCLLIRNAVISEFGPLEPAYCESESAIKAFIARANRCGFRVALANHAHLYNGTALPVSALPFSGSPEADTTLFSRRYPEFSASMAEYLASSDYCFEKLLSDWAVRTGNGSEFHLAIDCHGMFKSFNGTFTATVAMVRVLAGIGGGWRLSLLCDADVAKFHGLDRIAGVEILPYEGAGGFDLLVKFAQPFSLQEFRDSSGKALKLIYTMLDTISWDCDYLRGDGLASLWTLTADLADGLSFISCFGQRMFNLRFDVPDSTQQLPCTLSLSHRDYLDEFPAQSGSSDSRFAVPAGLWQRRFLVFGNKYYHKFMIPTLELLSDQLQECHFWGFGIEEFSAENVTPLPSGSLSVAELECLYSSSDAVIFPSLYEGFGFPIPEALARGKVVFARDSELNREIRDGWSGPGVLVLYADNRHLIDCLHSYDHCVEQAAESMKGFAEVPRDWHVVAAELRSFFERVAGADRRLDKTRKRLKLLRMMNTLGQDAPVATGPRINLNGTCWLDFKSFMADTSEYLLVGIKKSPLLSQWQSRLAIKCIKTTCCALTGAYDYYLKKVRKVS